MFSLELVESLKHESLGHRHHSAIDETVVKGVGEVDFIRSHNLLHHESAAKTLSVIVFHIQGVTSCLDSVVQLRRSCKCH